MTNDERAKDAMLDQAIDALRADDPDERVITGVGQRAWARIEAEVSAGQVEDDGSLEDLIPDYLAGGLDEGQRMLVEDRIGSDPAFRAAVAAARSGAPRRRRPADAPLPIPTALPTPRWRVQMAWAAAAAVMLFAGLSTWWLGQDLLMPDRALAQVAAVEGGLVAVDADGAVPVAIGDNVLPRQRLRATDGGGAVLTLSDGSRLELDARAELALRTRGSGVIVDLERGNIVIEAAPQGRGRLRVATDDTDVAVKGTIFAVRHGTKGSRVSVIEGEVAVASGRERANLKPGEQFSSSPLLGSVPVYQDVAWSQNAEQYEEILAALVEIGREIDETVERPGPRTSSRLAAVAPPNTHVFVSLPNLGETFAESYELFRTRVSENPVLAEWWATRMDEPEMTERIDLLVATMGRLGGQLGDEVALTLSFDESGEMALPMLIAEVDDPAAFRAVVEAEWNNVAAMDEEGELPPVRFLDDPVAFVNENAVIDPGTGAIDGGEASTNDDAAATDDESIDETRYPRGDIDPAMFGDGSLWMWTGGNVVGVAPMPAPLAPLSLAATGGETMDADLLAGIDEAMADGADALFAADLGAILELRTVSMLRNDNEAEVEALSTSGLAGVSHVFATQVDRDGRAEMEATLAFDGPRQGLAGMLAAPAPMGALGFISSEASAVGAAVIEQPERILAQLLEAAQRIDGLPTDDPDAAAGIETMQALAAPLGGEVAFAIDGPLLPEPSWKLIVEVYDDVALQAAIEAAVARMNERLEARMSEMGDELPEALRDRRLQLVEGESGGRPVWTLGLEGADAFAMHYALADGYFIATPNPALIGEALRVRATGLDITTAEAFRSALPAGAEMDYSVLAWQDLASLLGDAAALAEEQLEARGAQVDLASSVAPSMIVAWADADRVRVAGAAEASALDFGTLLGATGLFGMDNAGHGSDRGFDPSSLYDLEMQIEQGFDSESEGR